MHRGYCDRLPFKLGRYATRPQIHVLEFHQAGSPLPGQKELKAINQVYEQLKAEVRQYLDMNLFMSESIAYIITKMEIASRTSFPPVDREAFMYKDIRGHRDTLKKPGWEEQYRRRTENCRCLELRKQDAFLTRKAHSWILSSLSCRLASKTSSSPSNNHEPGMPQLLLRAFHSGSHTIHDEELGFISSIVIAEPDFDATSLTDSLKISRGTLENHCQGSNHSELIALSDSLARILKIICTWNDKAKREGRIAIINTTKLKQMGVLFQRTTTLATRWEISLWNQANPGGLQYANDNYWVAYRWIPSQCIEGYTTPSDLQQYCRAKGIRKSLKSTLRQYVI